MLPDPVLGVLKSGPTISPSPLLNPFVHDEVVQVQAYPGSLGPIASNVGPLRRRHLARSHGTRLWETSVNRHPKPDISHR